MIIISMNINIKNKNPNRKNITINKGKNNASKILVFRFNNGFPNIFRELNLTKIIKAITRNITNKISLSINQKIFIPI